MQPPEISKVDEYMFVCLIQDIAVRCSSYGSISHIITLPFLGTGGAEKWPQFRTRHPSAESKPFSANRDH